MGADILDGKATVVTIRRAYVVLQEAEKLTVAPLFAKAEAVAGALGPERAIAQQPLSPARNAVTKPKTAMEPQTPGVQKLSGPAYRLDRKHLNGKLKDLTLLAPKCTPRPNTATASALACG